MIRPGSVLTITLILILIILAIRLLGVGTNKTIPTVAIAHPQPVVDVDTSVIAEPVRFPSKLADYTVVIDRPLFHASRRPLLYQPPPKPKSPPPPPPKPKPLPKPPSLDLVGIMIIDGRSIALAHDNNSDVSLRLESGDSVADWEVTEITDRTIKMKNGDTVYESRLPITQTIDNQ
ncbi:MAG: hypothetical protein DHS20C01_01690 [marine bacterium B5-7]|nr:MAG: hypothetical protein DHS20C01_01690 [marine bacterium B5-7]